MGSQPVLKPREVVALLEGLGFQEVRQRGSHRQYRHPDGRGTTVPFHSGRDISPTWGRRTGAACGLAQSRWCAKRESKMDQSEELVERYLKHLGYSKIVYEPDGNVPPDFVLDGRIAIEVRRLNQNEPTSSGFRGLEETAIPLKTRVRKLVESLGPPTADATWFVFYKHFSNSGTDGLTDLIGLVSLIP